MKRLISAFALMAVVATASADYSRYYSDMPVEIKQVEEFSVPSTTVHLTDFGAVGDGVTLCTDAFAKAIAELSSKGGGRLIVPPGVWLTGPIELCSNLELRLERNALVLFSPDKSLFIDPTPGASRVKACISAQNCSNIIISGEGILDGNGAQWRPVKRMKVSDTEWRQFHKIGGVERDNGALWYPWQPKSGYPDIASTPEAQEKMRNDLFRIHYCENIMLKGVTFQNAPKFHVHPFYSSNIIIDGITVRCPWNAQNGDAIDLSDCRRALIVNSTVDAGDDGICMKSGEADPKAKVNGCADILIKDNTVYHAHGGFVIGSEDVTAMERIVVRNCVFSGTDTGLRFKSGVGRGGKTADIFISNIYMADIKDQAIVFQCNYVNRPAGVAEDYTPDISELKNVPEFTDIHIKDIVCRGAAVGIAASGIQGLNCVHDIDISHSVIVYTEKATEIDSETASVTLTDVKLIPDRK